MEMEGMNLWNKPKSVRQIGEIPACEKVYIEDYVMRFLKKISTRGEKRECAAVLLGVSFYGENEKIYRISGIVEIPEFSARSKPEIPDHVWERVYTEIKDNFTDPEIVGWFYCSPGFSLGEANRLLEIHKRNFLHGDKILYLYEEDGKDDGVFMYRGGRMERQKGYYIYYEKNPEMLHYMERAMEKEIRENVSPVEQEDDRVLRNIRGIIEEKEKQKQKKKQRDNRVGYGAGVMIAMTALLIGASALRNQNTLNQMKEQLSSLQELTEPIKETEQTTVETIGSSLVKENKAASSSAVSVTSTAIGGETEGTPQPQVTQAVQNELEDGMGG